MDCKEVALRISSLATGGSVAVVRIACIVLLANGGRHVSGQRRGLNAKDYSSTDMRNC